MRIILVTSTVTYLKDNYLGLFEYLLERGKLSKSIKIVAGLFLKTHGPGLFLQGLGLTARGVRGIGGALTANTLVHMTGDPRLKLFRRLGIPALVRKSINHESVAGEIARLEPDLLVNLRTRQIYRKRILKIPKIGCINIHHGILPRERGVFCDLRAWARGEPVGFSIHWMNSRPDDGRIILTKQLPMDGVAGYMDIPMLSARHEGPALAEALEMIRDQAKIAGRDNPREGVVFHRTPDMNEIQEMLSKGMKL